MNHLPNNIRIIREICLYSQDDFAALLDVNRSKLASYERGVQPKMEFIIKLSELVAIPIDYLIKTRMTRPTTLFGNRQLKMSYLASIEKYTNNLTNA